MSVDVIVVGAGLSGLRAAVEIHRQGISCVVLEALNRVGGKTLSVDPLPEAEGRDGKVDLGAAWINDTSQSEMYSLARRFDFDLIKQHVSGTYLRQKSDETVVSYPWGFGDVSCSPTTWLVCIVVTPFNFRMWRNPKPWAFTAC